MIVYRNGGAKIRRAIRRGYRLPAGVLMLRKTLVLDRDSGAILKGRGRTKHRLSQRHEADAKGGATRIMYDGPADQPAVILNGTNSIHVADLTIERTTPGVVVAIRSLPGWGNEGSTYERVAVLGAGGVGWQMGEPGDHRGHNNATQVWRDCFVAGMDAAWQSNNEQSVANRLRDCGAMSCGVMYDVVRGGCITIDGGNTWDVPVIVRTSGGGPNAAGISIRDIKPDGGLLNGGCTLIDAGGATGTISAVVSGVTIRSRLSAKRRGVSSDRTLFIQPHAMKSSEDPSRWWSMETSGIWAEGHKMYEIEGRD